MALVQQQTVNPEILNLTGREKAAGLLIGLGPEITGTILKLMPEGELDKITTELVDIRPDGSILLNMDYFDYATGLKMVNEERWRALFGIPARQGEWQQCPERD